MYNEVHNALEVFISHSKPWACKWGYHYSVMHGQSEAYLVTFSTASPPLGQCQVIRLTSLLENVAAGNW